MRKNINKQQAYLRVLIENKESDHWNPLQREALFPRELLQPLYEKWNREYATNGLKLAEDFYRFLLMQSK